MEVILCQLWPAVQLWMLSSGKNFKRMQDRQEFT